MKYPQSMPSHTAMYLSLVFIAAWQSAATFCSAAREKGKAFRRYAYCAGLP